MKRKIGWKSGQFDEIELIYEKADGNENLSKMILQLEETALFEAKQAYAPSGLLNEEIRTVLNPQQFDDLSATDKETAIKKLANKGFGNIHMDVPSATITIKLNAVIQKTLACTVFEILNRLEKLDGAVNVLHSKWTLELQTPVGGKNGLFQWELFIMKLYPWLSVREVSTNEVASGIYSSDNSAGENISDKRNENKSNISNPKGSGEFLQDMKHHSSFNKALDQAERELGSVIQKRSFSLKYQGDVLSYDKWCSLDKMEKLNFILSMGNYGISIRAVVCVDFAEIIPYCIAIALLYGVWSNQLQKQLIDAGDGTDVTKLAEALTMLYDCCDKWECTIIHPVHVKIGSRSSEVSKLAETESEKSHKKSFWQRLFNK